MKRRVSLYKATYHAPFTKAPLCSFDPRAGSEEGWVHGLGSIASGLLLSEMHSSTSTREKCSEVTKRSHFARKTRGKRRIEVQTVTVRARYKHGIY